MSSKPINNKNVEFEIKIEDWNMQGPESPEHLIRELELDK